MQFIREIKEDPNHRKLYRYALIITLSGNILLVVSKGVIAYFSNSVAIYADAANSASDVLYSLLIIVGLWLSQKPPDLSHPQGHSRFEPLMGLVVVASMTYAGFEAARASISRFLSGGLAVEPGLPTLVLLFSATVKGGMFLSIKRIAQQLHSPTLDVTARDNLSDVLTSSAAFIGVILSKYVHPLADPIGGILVAAWIFRAAFSAGRENLSYLTGAGASPELLGQITQAAAAIPGVINVHQVIAEYAGPRMIIDIHINVNGQTTLDHIHTITEEVRRRLEALPEIDRVYVHVEPPGVEN
jgi:cation diffusion facilitator family transporter